MPRYDIDRLDNRDEKKIRRLCAVIRQTIGRYHRAQVEGLDRFPAGPGLLVANHNAGMWVPEAYLMMEALYSAHGLEGLPYGLGHEVALSLPIINEFVAPLGAIRAGHKNAHRVFESGGKCLVFPGGDEDSFRLYKDRNAIRFGGRTGYIRLALKAQVPIIPVVTAGAHESLIVISQGRRIAKALRLKHWARMKVLPISLCLPWGVMIGPGPFFVPIPTRIKMEFLEPITLDGTPEDADNPDRVRALADHVEGVMQEALVRLAQKRV